MAIHRNAVTNALTSKTVKEIIKKRNIKLISYGDLTAEQSRILFYNDKPVSIP